MYLCSWWCLVLIWFYGKINPATGHFLSQLHHTVNPTQFDRKIRRNFLRLIQGGDKEGHLTLAVNHGEWPADKWPTQWKRLNKEGRIRVAWCNGSNSDRYAKGCLFVTWPGQCWLGESLHTHKKSAQAMVHPHLLYNQWTEVQNGGYHTEGGCTKLLLGHWLAQHKPKPSGECKWFQKTD